MASRLVLSAAVCFIAASPPAQSEPPRPKPPGLEKIDDVPPPPQVLVDPAVEPRITTTTRGDDRIEEFRVKGKLYKVRVTPAAGPAYWLVDPKGDGNFIRSTTDIVPNNAVPMWVVFEW